MPPVCYTNGLTQEGMNMAMTSGLLAAKVAAEALAQGDFTAKRLARYAREVKQSFVLRDLKTFGRAIDFLHHDRLFSDYPRVVSALMEDIYRSDGRPRTKIGRMGLRAVRGVVPIRQLIADAIRVGRAYLW